MNKTTRWFDERTSRIGGPGCPARGARGPRRWRHVVERRRERGRERRRRRRRRVDVRVQRVVLLDGRRHHRLSRERDDVLRRRLNEHLRAAGALKRAGVKVGARGVGKVHVSAVLRSGAVVPERGAREPEPSYTSHHIRAPSHLLFCFIGHHQSKKKNTSVIPQSSPFNRALARVNRPPLR